LGVDSSIDINNVPLRVLALEELFDLISKCSRVFLKMVLDTLDMKNI
jgi:hypothetical protein